MRLEYIFASRGHSVNDFALYNQTRALSFNARIATCLRKAALGSGALYRFAWLGDGRRWSCFGQLGLLLLQSNHRHLLLVGGDVEVFDVVLGADDSLQSHLEVCLRSRIGGFREAIIKLVSLLVELEEFSAVHRGLQHVDGLWMVVKGREEAVTGSKTETTKTTTSTNN